MSSQRRGWGGRVERVLSGEAVGSRRREGGNDPCEGRQKSAKIRLEGFGWFASTSRAAVDKSKRGQLSREEKSRGGTDWRAGVGKPKKQLTSFHFFAFRGATSIFARRVTVEDPIWGHELAPRQ